MFLRSRPVLSNHYWSALLSINVPLKLSDLDQILNLFNPFRIIDSLELIYKYLETAIQCVCVCVFSSHSFWTSMDVPAGVTQEESHTGFLIHLLSAVHAVIFLASRIQPFLSLVDREVEFCVLTILIVLHPLGIFILVF